MICTSRNPLYLPLLKIKRYLKQFGYLSNVLRCIWPRLH